MRPRCERRSRTDASRKSPPPVGPHFHQRPRSSSAIGGRGSRMQDRRLSWTTVLLALIERSATLDRSPQADSRSPLSRRTFASQGARPPECDSSTSTIKTRAVRLATARVEGCEYVRAPSDLQSRVLLRCLGNPFPSSSLGARCATAVFLLHCAAAGPSALGGAASRRRRYSQASSIWYSPISVAVGLQRRAAGGARDARDFSQEQDAQRCVHRMLPEVRTTCRRRHEWRRRSLSLPG